MKVMQILPRLWSGGVEKGVLDLTAFFKHKGWEADKTPITNIVASGGGRLVKELKEKGITHYTIDTYRKSPFTFLSIPKIKRIIEREEVDIVHARSRVPAWVSFFASRGRCQFITTAHGVYKNKFFSQVMGWGKFVICPSRFVAQCMHNNFSVPSERIVIIPRWVSFERFKFLSFDQRKDSNVVVSIGRISPSKGYEYLIEGFKEISIKYPNLILKIVGSPDSYHQDYLNCLTALVKRLALGYQVKFLGYRQDIENILKEARLLIAPSAIEESFGRVIVEAFASGVPVVASNLGAFNEIVEDNIDGVLVEPRNSKALAKAMLKVLEHNSFAEQLSQKAYKKAKQFYSLEECLKKNEEVYGNTLDILRILVIKISSLGDLILAIPSLRAIREYFPKAKISLLTLKKYSSFLDNCPYIDELITVERDYKKILNILSIANCLRVRSLDFIVDFQNNRASHLIAYLAFAYKSFGYSLRWGFLLTKKIKYSDEDPPLRSQERILYLLGVKLPEKKLIFWDTKEVKSKISIPYDEIIGINVSASLKWRSKNWPTPSIIKFIELVYEKFPNYNVMLLGSKEADRIANEIENHFSKPQGGSEIKNQLINYCAKTRLEDLAPLIKKLKALITPDTATMHLACALGIPTFALFGPTDPMRHTVDDKNLHIFHKKLPCSFCYRSVCRAKEKNLCMKQITPEEVFEKIKEIISLA